MASKGATVRSGETRPVLVIDDDRDIIYLATEVLESRGFNVVSAGNGIEGLELARSLRPAVIVCDVMLPGMTGFETVSALRKSPSTCRIPVVFTTGYASLQAASPFPDDLWLMKPFTLNGLAEVVEAATHLDSDIQ